MIHARFQGKSEVGFEDSSDGKGKPGVTVKFEKKAEKIYKAAPKRSQTWKQEPQAEKVIEEGSDDVDSFASDTPAAAAHRKRKLGTNIVIANVDTFDQATAEHNQNDIMASIEAKTTTLKPDITPSNIILTG